MTTTPPTAGPEPAEFSASSARWRGDVREATFTEDGRLLAPDGDECTHYTGRARYYDSRRSERRESVALEFTSESGGRFVLYVDQYKGATCLFVQPWRETIGNADGDWTDLCPTREEPAHDLWAPGFPATQPPYLHMGAEDGEAP